jgi:cellulose synthase/poly-beta-1,6-N-acetylglucosamine synthase-like glycosyltransferase
MSIVTPSYNQVAFLPAALESVHCQDYPGLEHVVIDGGSSDGSVQVIEDYRDQLHYWVSEPDGGQYDAINRGFSRTTGEVMAWLNSDDMYLPGSLTLVGEIFARFPDVEWLTTQYQLTWDERGSARLALHLRGMSSAAALQGQYLPHGPWHAVGVIQQESTFWRRSAWERAGGRVDPDLHYAGDFDLWMRMAKATQLHTVAAPIAGFRRQAAQKTAGGYQSYLTEAMACLRSHGQPPIGRSARLRRGLLRRLTSTGREPSLASPLSRLVLGRRAHYEASGFRWATAEWERYSELLY